MPVTLYLTTGSNDVGLFNIYSGSIVDEGALLEAQVSRDRLVAGWCTDVETTVYTIQSSTVTCQSKAYANVALFRCDLEITATGDAPTPIPVPVPAAPVPSPTAPTAPTPNPQPVPQPTAPVAPQPVPAPVVTPVPQPQPVAPVPAPAAPVPVPAAPVPVPVAPQPVPVPAPVSCGEWELEGGPGGSGLFQYTDCVTGIVEQESVESGDSGPVCSRDTPSLISGYGTMSYLGTCTS